MKSRIEIETGETRGLSKVLEPSFGRGEKVRQEVRMEDDSLVLETEAETLGQLRGATDSVFRLASLAKKIIER